MQTTERIYRVERSEISYVRFTLESYDGTALVSTLDPHAAYIRVIVCPGGEALVDEITASLVRDEGIMARAGRGHHART